MLAIMHSHYWDGSEGGGGDPPAPSNSTFSGWQVVVTCSSALVFCLVV